MRSVRDEHTVWGGTWSRDRKGAKMLRIDLEMVAQTNEADCMSLSIVEDPSFEDTAGVRNAQPLAMQGVESDCDSLISIDSRTGDGARTHDSHVGNAEPHDTKPIPDKTLRTLPVSVAHQLPILVQLKAIP